MFEFTSVAGISYVDVKECYVKYNVKDEERS
jgi:hypothetical protein